MKKLVLFLSACALLASAVWVGAAGDAGDPLASLSYLNGEFSQRAEKKIDQALEQSDKDLAERLENGEVGEAAATWQETRLKEGDTLHGVTGTGVLLLAGRGRVTYESGAVVDVTTGAVVPSGTNLTANHRYLTAEDTTAAYTVTSETAVVDYQGQYAFSYSDRPDYNAMAAALKSGKVHAYLTDFPTPEVMHMDGAIVLPHLGASTAEAEDNCAMMAVRELMDYLENGTIKNSVNYPACDMGPVREGTSRVAVMHANVPNMISQITNAFGDEGINISDMTNKARGEHAYTLLDLDQPVTEAALTKLASIDGVRRVRQVK